MTNETRDLDALNRQIADLKIELSESSDGLLTVCSTAEPLFCYDAHSKEEAATLVADTLLSYARHFFHIQGLNVKTRSDPLPETQLQIEHGKPIFRITPVFDLAA